MALRKYQREMFEAVKIRRAMPWLRIGMRVDVAGKAGIVKCGNQSGNIDVIFTDGHTGNCHPKWETTYFDESNTIVHDYKTTP